MTTLDPLMPIPLLVLYLVLALTTFTVCFLAFVAMFRTKRTPYATKLLSMGLLTYDNLFLLISCFSKMFNYNDIYVVWHITRGFQLASQLIVCSMALERVFVLNWPYKYLKVVTDTRTKCVCITIFFFSFLQYAVVRVGVCYARNKGLNCGWGMPVYFVIYTVLVPAISFVSFFKIHKIIRGTGNSSTAMSTFRQYKRTAVSFMLLINTTFSQVVWIGLSVLYFTRTAQGIKEEGFVATLTDWVNVFNCIVDVLIYVIWFRETRMELMKLVKGVFPAFKTKIEKLRIEIYQINLSENVTYVSTIS